MNKEDIAIIKYADWDKSSLRKRLVSRTQLEKGEVIAVVSEIIENIRENGDSALLAYIKKFNNADLTADRLRVTGEEIDEACASLSKEFLDTLKRSARNIEAFHERQKEKSWFSTGADGEILGMMVRPLDTVGVYVPGGKAAYPSSVLMNVIPAKVAGVRRIIMMTPPGPDGRINPGILAAASIAGVDEIYRGGGAEAIGSMAFGTETIPRVDKITGPGNIYVATAKKLVFGTCGIDSIAGPSEILILADDSANPSYVAADLLSQAEHDEMASSLLVTTSSALAEAVRTELCIQAEALSRKEIVYRSLSDYGGIIVADTIEEAVEAANQIAPEHMEVCTREPFSLLDSIRNAGAIFIGNYSSEPLGDYYAGPNHVLPTCGTARFFSPLNVSDFMKKSSVIYYTPEALFGSGQDVMRFAEEEGLDAHANAVRLRYEDCSKNR